MPASTMGRSSWAARNLIALAGAFFAGSHSSASADEDPRLDWWRDARFGIFIHWGLYSIPAGRWGDATGHGEWIRSTAQISRAEYAQFIHRFNPVKFDAAAWAKAARDAGAGYVVITTKHHDGFCLFDSALTEFDVASTPWGRSSPGGRDVMRELADAVRAEGLRMGWYYSIMDWHHPDYLPRRDWESDFPTEGADFERYEAYMRGQLNELLTKYGPISVMWFDGQWEGNWNDERGQETYQHVRRLAPSVIVNSRVGRAGGDWGLDRESGMLGDYATPEQTIPGAVIADLDWETCMTMNRHWGYNAADTQYKSVDVLIRMLCDTASKGGNFLLNVGPTGEGEFPPESLEGLAAIGDWLEINGDSIRGTRAGPLQELPWGRSTIKKAPLEDGGGWKLFLHIFDWPNDGKLHVPDLLDTPRNARLMTGEVVRSSREAGSLMLELPGPAAGTAVTVVALDFPPGTPPDVAVPPTITVPAPIFTEHLDVNVTTTRSNVQVRATIDGTEPDATTPAVESLRLTESATVLAACFRDGIRVSPVARAGFVRVEPRRSHVGPRTERGLRAEYFEADVKSVDELTANGARPVRSRVTEGFDLSIRERERYWGVRFTGYLDVPTTGVYRLATQSDDGSRLWIGDTLVVDNDNPHSMKEESGWIALEAGLHPIEVRFFENWGGFGLTVLWTGPGIAKQQIPVSAFFLPEEAE